ncbi:hypothetical protein ACNQR7_26975 [Mycolicibacterium senegalense]
MSPQLLEAKTRNCGSRKGGVALRPLDTDRLQRELAADRRAQHRDRRR